MSPKKAEKNTPHQTDSFFCITNSVRLSLNRPHQGLVNSLNFFPALLFVSLFSYFSLSLASFLGMSS